MKYIFSILLFFSIVSCNNDDDSGVNCTAVFVYGLNVTVRDASSNEILKEGIIVVATDGSYSEELSTIEGIDDFFGAGERQGNYIITVTGEGYKTFVSDIISVSGDVCHVSPELLEVSLMSN